MLKTWLPMNIMWEDLLRLALCSDCLAITTTSTPTTTTDTDSTTGETAAAVVSEVIYLDKTDNKRTGKLLHSTTWSMKHNSYCLAKSRSHPQPDLWPCFLWCIVCYCVLPWGDIRSCIIIIQQTADNRLLVSWARVAMQSKPSHSLLTRLTSSLPQKSASY